MHRILEDVSATSMDTDVAVISGRFDTLRQVRMEWAAIPIGFYVMPTDGAATHLARTPRVIAHLLALG